MTLEDVKKEIQFSQRVGQYGIQIRHTATIQITAEIGVDADPSRQPPKEEIKRWLTEEILRRLYDNRQREFAELLLQHALAHPISSEIHDSRHKLLMLARHMMPKDE